MNNEIKDAFGQKEKAEGFTTTDLRISRTKTSLSHLCPSGLIRGQFFPGIRVRKTAFLQKRGIVQFFKSESLKLLQIRLIRLKTDANGARNFSNFWRISPGVVYGGRGPGKMLKAEC